MSIRFGNLPDSSLVVKNIRPNHRVLVASASYLRAAGTPDTIEDLHRHRCLALELRGMVMNEWRFEHDGKQSALRFTPAMVCDDGALLRQWVLADAGIASKSWWDVKRDVEQGGCACCLRKVLLGLAALIKKCRAAICLSAATPAAATGYRLHTVFY
jgi:DNA-binding transcriptional LysR family regulator